MQLVFEPGGAILIPGSWPIIGKNVSGFRDVADAFQSVRRRPLRVRMTKRFILTGVCAVIAVNASTPVLQRP